VGPNHKSKGHKSRPAGITPWPVGHTLSQFRMGLDGYAPKSVGASTMFGPVQESSRLPLPIPRALHSSEVNGDWVGSWRSCLAATSSPMVFSSILKCSR
jgi:hypothetical protein